MTTSRYDEEFVLEQIDAMRAREENTARCHDYFTPATVDSRCRKLMVNWFFSVVDSFALSRETVCVATSILDRYLCSGRGMSIDVLKCARAFQRSAITSLYMAIKVNESSVLGLKLLVRLCRGVYAQGDFVATEREILFALDWRVCESLTTPMEYVRHLVQLLLPEIADVADNVLENAARRMDIVASDAYFSTCRASSVGVACLAGALDDVSALSLSSPLDVGALWGELSSLLDWDIASNEIRRVERRLDAVSSCVESRTPMRASLRRNTSSKTFGQPSSPVSVVQ
jgi:hypothetical protein